MVRSKNNGAVHGSGETGDTLNLLDSTDSDVEWLNLPPLKGKKPKKRKSLKVQKSGDTSLWTFLKVFLLLVVVVALVLLSIISSWQIAQLNDMKETIRQLEIRSSKSSEDVDKLSPDLQNINKTLHHVISDISKVNSTVAMVSGTLAKLSKSLDAAPELKELPGKLQSVSKVLADLGSDVSGMKDTFDSVSPFMKSTSDTLDDLKKQIEEIQAKAETDTSDGKESDTVTPDLENFRQVMTQQVQEMNSTLSAQVSVLIKASSKQEERLADLENTSNLLQANLSSLSTHTSSSVPQTNSESADNVDYSSDKFHQNVASIVHELISSEGQSASVNAVMANITKVLDSLNELKDKYEHLETSSSTDAGEVSSGNYVTLEMFNTLGEGFEDKFTTLNSSFVSLKSDVKTMSLQLTHQSNTITNLTHHLDATKEYMINYMNQKLNGESNFPTTMKAVQSSQASTVDTVKVRVTTAQPVQSQETTGSNTTTVAPEGEKEHSAAVSVGNIKSFSDLELNFRRWDLKGTGLVNPNILSGYLGPETPDENDLKPFDEDHNGLYSLEEFAKAFGFEMPTTQKPSTTGTTQGSPPR